MKVYEIVDATDDERYFTLGLFASLQEVIRELDDCEDPPCDCYEDCAIIEVRERDVSGWCDMSTGKFVAKYVFSRSYSDDDDCEWTIKKELSPQPQGPA